MRMKMISMIVTVLGVIALILAVVDRSMGTHIAGVTAPSFLRGACTLYLLALVLMCYDKCYGAKPQP
jgi:hypothetical protein